MDKDDRRALGALGVYVVYVLVAIGLVLGLAALLGLCVKVFLWVV
jgi:hypothetical protein